MTTFPTPEHEEAAMSAAAVAAVPRERAAFPMAVALTHMVAAGILIEKYAGFDRHAIDDADEALKMAVNELTQTHAIYEQLAHGEETISGEASLLVTILNPDMMPADHRDYFQAKVDALLKLS